MDPLRGATHKMPRPGLKRAQSCARLAHTGQARYDAYVAAAAAFAFAFAAAFNKSDYDVVSDALEHASSLMHDGRRPTKIRPEERKDVIDRRTTAATAPGTGPTATHRSSKLFLYPSGNAAAAIRSSRSHRTNQSGHMSDPRVSTPVFGLVPVASSRPHSNCCVFGGMTASLKSAPVMISASLMVDVR